MSLTHEHTMRRDRILASNKDEWLCPTCGKRLVVNWPDDEDALELLVFDRASEYVLVSKDPANGQATHKYVIETNKPTVVHRVDRRHVPPPSEVDLSAMRPVDEDDSQLSDDLRHWLDEAGFDTWWSDDRPQATD